MEGLVEYEFRPQGQQLVFRIPPQVAGDETATESAPELFERNERVGACCVREEDVEQDEADCRGILPVEFQGLSPIGRYQGLVPGLTKGIGQENADGGFIIENQ